MYEFLDYQVQDVMSEPVSVSPEATLGEVEAILERRGFNAVPVVDGAERVLGWASSLDLLKAFDFPEDVILPPYEKLMQKPISDVMQRDVLSVCPRTPLSRVLAKLVAARVRSFPVLDGDRLVGVVARRDVMQGLRQGTEGRKP